MITIGNARFADALAALGTDIFPTSAASVDLLFDGDLPVRVTVHPHSGDVVVDAFACDASGLFGEVRASAARLMLRLNRLALRGRPFVLSLTPSDIVAVTVQVPLAAGGDALADAVSYASVQAAGVRRMFAALAPEDDAGFTTHRA